MRACECKNKDSPAAGMRYVPNIRPELFCGAGIGQHALRPQAGGEGEAGDGRLLGRVHVAAALANGGRGGQAVRRIRIPATIVVKETKEYRSNLNVSSHIVSNCAIYLAIASSRCHI